MNFVVIGGSGLIGSKVVKGLEALGHSVVAASLKSGVNIVTGEGLEKALAEAEVVVDLANSPSFEAGPAMEFFEKAGRNIAAAEKKAGVKKHVALSVVGTDRLQESGYFRAKLVQEKAIAAAGIPYTLLRATQFFEFIHAVAHSGAVADGTVRLTSAKMQPMESGDVAAMVVEAAVAPAVNGMVEIAGPEPFGIDEIGRLQLEAEGDLREVITDDSAMYFGVLLKENSLMPGGSARIGKVRFREWLKRTVKPAAVGVK